MQIAQKGGPLPQEFALHRGIASRSAQEMSAVVLALPSFAAPGPVCRWRVAPRLMLETTRMGKRHRWHRPTAHTRLPLDLLRSGRTCHTQSADRLGGGAGRAGSRSPECEERQPDPSGHSGYTSGRGERRQRNLYAGSVLAGGRADRSLLCAEGCCVGGSGFRGTLSDAAGRDGSQRSVRRRDRKGVRQNTQPAGTDGRRQNGALSMVGTPGPVFGRRSAPSSMRR